MSDAVRNLAAAEARAVVARERLSFTLAQVQAKLDPRERAHQVVRDASDAGQMAIETVKEKPAILAGVAAVAGLFLARHRIATLFGRGSDDRSPDDSGLNPVTRTTS